jgi:serine/threonine-protein kinase HipA
MTISVQHSLTLLADDVQVGTLQYEPTRDRWTLSYQPSWSQSPNAFPLSPALPLKVPATGYAPGAVKRFVENLLPEGRALDISATTFNVSKTNIFGLIHALGIETTGALRFWPSDAALPNTTKNAIQREVSLAELDQRLGQRAHLPFVIWDGKPRMSVAGYQDKLLIYLDAPLTNSSRMYLVEPPLASTHILKPQPLGDETPHLVINEHYCMTLAQRMGLPVAPVSILRTPTSPVLVVTRFDRLVVATPDGIAVRRLHVIDAVQAADMPVSYKYERNIGHGDMVSHIRDGVSFEVLFARVGQTINKAAARLHMLRWALFQFLIGNSDAHGKNYSFFVQSQGLEPAPWYDLVSVVQYPKLSHEMAMAFGDVFVLDDIKSFAMADFANRCGINRAVLNREAKRLAKLVQKHAKDVAASPSYLEDERVFAEKIGAFVVAQSARLVHEASEAVRIKNEFL